MPTFEELMKQEKVVGANIRMVIPADVDRTILQFQETWKKVTQRKITKEQVIWKLMLAGQEALEQEKNDLEKIAETIS